MGQFPRSGQVSNKTLHANLEFDELGSYAAYFSRRLT